MKFSEITGHLSERGFVTRELWRGQAVMFFGMDNSAWRTLFDGRKSYWSPNLQEVGAVGRNQEMISNPLKQQMKYFAI